MKKLLPLMLLMVCLVSLSGCVVNQVDPSAPDASFWEKVSALTIFNLFVFGGLGFWIYCSIWLLALILYCDDKDWSTPIIILIVGAFGMWLLGAFNPFIMLFAYIWANPFSLLGIIFGYIILGLIYASVKLKLLSNELAKSYGDHLKGFLYSKKIDGLVIPASLNEEWEKYCEKNRISSQPSIDTYKERLIFWWTWWPLSLPRTLVREFVIRFFENIYKLFEKLYKYCRGYFQRILLSSFAKFNTQEESKAEVAGNSDSK